MRARDIQHNHAAEEAHADLAHFVVLQPFINRNEHGIIKNFYNLCKADAVLADTLLASGVIPLELPDLISKYSNKPVPIGCYPWPLFWDWMNQAYFPWEKFFAASAARATGDHQIVHQVFTTPASGNYTTY